jgi:hypothetical protein
MKCETMQLAASERLDGERLSPDIVASLDTHLEACAQCRAFLNGAAHVRSALRIRPAEDVPDLTASIMRAVQQEPVALRRRARASVRGVAAPMHLRPRHLAPVTAALVLGLILGSAVVGGPWQRPSTAPLAMAAVIRDSQSAAGTVTAYRATYAITERGLSAEVPQRQLTMDVAFRAPEQYRVDISDKTAYPSKAWTPTDLTYVGNGRATYRSGPTGCPGDLPVQECPRTQATVTRTSASSLATSPPSDLVIPLTSLADTPGVRITGTGTVSDRPAVRIEIPYERAEPLFSFTGLGGRWRPFFPSDRVVLWLDQAHWFPLRYTVYPSQDPQRRAWELRFGLPVESSGGWIFDVRATGIDRTAPVGSFAIPRVVQAQPVPLAQLPERLGYAPLTPPLPEGFSLRATLMPPGPGASSPMSILSYTRGLTYLVIAEHPGSGLDGVSGAGPGTEQVRLTNGGIAYYSAATQDHGRTLSIRSSSGETLYLETNLTRERLLAIAGSLPILGQAALPSGTSG